MSRTPAGRLFIALALLACAPPLQAQRLALKLGAGVALPDRGDVVRHDAGISAMASLEYRPSGIWGLRLDAEHSRLAEHDRNPHVKTEGVRGDLPLYGMALNGVIRVPGAVVAPYALAGLGLHRIRTGGPSERGQPRSVALQAGAGVDVTRWRVVNPFVEVRAAVHYYSGFDQTGELSAFSSYPVLVGVRVR